MRQSHEGLREGTARQPKLIGRDELIKSAPAEPEAFLRWGAQHQREEGKFELSRGRVSCDLRNTSRSHARVARNIALDLGRRLDLDAFDINVADFAVRTPFGARSPDVVVDRAMPYGDLSTSTSIFIAEALSPSTAGKDLRRSLKSTRRSTRCRLTWSAPRTSHVHGFGRARRMARGPSTRLTWRVGKAPSPSPASASSWPWPQSFAAFPMRQRSSESRC
jgi:hypothetical protein